MVKTMEDVRGYLRRLSLSFQEASEETLVVRGSENENLAITQAGPVLVFRVKLMEVPPNAQKEFFKTLLELNASEMMHGTYGIEGDAVIISDALQLKKLDYNEFSATVDDIMLAVASHHKRLSKYRSTKTSQNTEVGLS